MRLVVKLVSFLPVLLLMLVTVPCYHCGDHGDFFFFVGEMTVTPEQIPADGQTNAEISVVVYFERSGNPVPGVWITVASSRNQGGNVLDTIEQPTVPTDADGRAVAYVWSSTPGQAQLTMYQGGAPDEEGAPVCSSWEDGACVELTVQMTFTE
jgi:hypothetical protein